MSTERFDVIFVGAGHNALTAACYLAKAGRSVCLLDRAPTPGGWVHSAELTLPGYVHDVYSALHPLFASGPVFAELGAELESHGLRYLTSEVSTAGSLADGRTALISTDPRQLTTELRRLGELDAWTALMTDVAPILSSFLRLLGAGLDTTAARTTLDELRRDVAAPMPFGMLLTTSGSELLRNQFASEEMVFAVLPWLLHLGIGPNDTGGALWAVVAMAALAGGNPTPEGGSGRLAEALWDLARSHGAQLRPGTDVDSILTTRAGAIGVITAEGERLQADEAVIATTTPDQLYGRLLRNSTTIPAAVRSQARRYGYRRGCFQINLALSGRPGFRDDRLNHGGALNLGRGVDELLTSVGQAERGYLPAYPSISWHEPTAIDPKRAPAGHGVVRIQVLDAPLSPTSDAGNEITVDGSWDADVAERFADRVIDEAALHVPGLVDSIASRHILTPADLARANPNAGPGDHAAGHQALTQALAQRPIPAHRGGYGTVVPRLFMIGAATWPGPGVSGSSGRAVARQLIERAGL